MGAWFRKAVAYLSFGGGLAIGVSGCELDEVTLAEPEDIMVVEAYVMVGDWEDQVSAFVHWTLGTRPPEDLADLEVTLTTESGETILLVPRSSNRCLQRGLGDAVEGVCYSADLADGFFRPGTRVDLEILQDDGVPVRGVTFIPENIELISPAVRGVCALPPGTAIDFIWNRSPGVWAYAAETEIKDLREALAAEGVQVETDSVALRGLAVSDSDTTVTFPQEFGIFERFDLEQELALALQEGLPRGATADVVIAALDQNYVNWVRGGNFNPSGMVRISSLRGGGEGVLGSVVRRVVVVRGGEPGDFPGGLVPSCLPIEQP